MLPLKINLARDPAPAPAGRSLRGVFTGVCATAFLPTRVIESWIPIGSDLRLGPTRGNGGHPVLFLMGRQQQVHNVALGLRFDYGFGREYPELLMIVPDLVVPSMNSLVVSLYARLFLTSFWSTLLGRHVYGFAKHVAKIDEQADRFVVRSRKGNELFNATIADDAAAPISSTGPEFNPFRDWFAQPVYSFNRNRPALANACYDFSHCELKPVSTSARLFKGLCSQTSGKHFETTGLDQSPCGSFRFSASWIFTAHQAVEPQRMAG